MPDVDCTSPQLCDALNRRHTPRSATLNNLPGAYVTHVVAPAGGELRLDPAALRDMGVQRVVVVDSERKGSVRMPVDTSQLAVVNALALTLPVALM